MTSTLRVLIVDDEPLIRKGIRSVLSGDPAVDVLTEAGDGQSAVHMIQVHRPDLVFLDVQMPEMDGFDVLDALSDSIRPAVVFVTAFDEYALRAFDVCAVDYLLKPFDDERLLMALHRAHRRIREAGSAMNFAALLQEIRHTRRAQRITVKTGNRVSYVPVDDVQWFEAADNYVRLHVHGKRHLVRDTITGLERRLDPEQFVRVHRSAIVNLNFVLELRTHASGDADVLLESGETVRISRGYRAAFEARVTGNGT